MSLNRSEERVMRLTVTLAEELAKVIGRGPTRDSDLREAVFYIHGIQHMVMSQSAARSHPRRYRLLGEQIANPLSVGQPAELDLTEREREVADLLCDGLPIKQIARQLDVTMSTVKTHVTHLYKKYGVQNRVQLVNAHR